MGDGLLRQDFDEARHAMLAAFADLARAGPAEAAAEIDGTASGMRQIVVVAGWGPVDGRRLGGPK